MSIELKFDVPEQKSGIVGVLNSRLLAQNDAQAIMAASLTDLAFKYEDIPDKERVISEVQNCLAAAQSDASNWENNLSPDLVVASQVYINIASTFSGIVNPVRDALRQDGNDAAKKVAKYFSGLIDSVDSSIDSVESWKNKLSDFKEKAEKDASNFTDSNQPFAALFEGDKENVEAAEAVLKKIEEKIKKLDSPVDNSTINKRQNVDYVAIVMTLTSVVFKSAPVAALLLAVRITGVVTTGLALQQLINEIDTLFDSMKDAASQKLIVTLLTQQLLALKAVQKVTGEMPGLISKVSDSLEKVIENLNSIKVPFTKAISELQDSQKPSEVVDPFDLGVVSEQFNEMERFGQASEDVSLASSQTLKLTFPSPEHD
ncbi:HBL/NHE enterotoxin family protein [Maridesulfovibrio bastinii]|uniref:HBL/NHE enterotoxin family protein n=1 Tax=Maridesulfovibrio bastinii TaxID=47157 RepID=UPI0005523262|nr:HBL/NHE enterotoxin family protein [Maridesulfovibrio bastinii]